MLLSVFYHLSSEFFVDFLKSFFLIFNLKYSLKNLSHFKLLEDGFYLVIRAVKLGPSIDTVSTFSGDNMDMKMRNGLSCAFIACVQKVHAIIPAIINAVIGNLFYRQRQMLQCFFITIKNALHVLFGYCKHVTVHVLSVTHKDQRMLVLVYLKAWELSAHYFTEYTIHDIASISHHLSNSNLSFVLIITAASERFEFYQKRCLSYRKI